MAGLEGLASIIYHEQQQPGSMLCAQHALNSLLQGNYFTAPDLSAIAQSLDDLEESYDDDNTGRTSGNMDDTGFFSVQVLDNALKVWGLNLVRWRSETMRPYQGHPHTQLAFILNLEQHWFTLRRFGQALSNIDLDPGDGHWFNLNSFLSAPEWVSKTYLGMVLQQAEAEGYSVFAVTQADPSAHLALPRTETDEISSTLPEPTSSRRPDPRIVTSRTVDTNPAGSSSRDGGALEGFEDEDYELQAALQASLQSIGSTSGGAGHDPSPAPLLSRSSIQLPRSDSNSPSTSTPHTGTHTPVPNPHPASASLDPNLSDHADLDPVAASMERNRVALQRVLEQQEFAQRELYSGEGLEPEEREALEARRAERRRQEEVAEEQLNRAIAESRSHARQGIEGAAENDEDNQDFVMAESPHFQEHALNRVYDDDDAEFQAAIRASLESAPADYQHPDFPSQTPSYLPPVAHGAATISEMTPDRDDAESVASDETSLTENPPSEPSSAPPTLEEIRQARLARFGL